MTSSVSCIELHGALTMKYLEFPSGVGEKTVSIFTNAFDSKPKDAKIKPILEAIRNGKYERQINRLSQELFKIRRGKKVRPSQKETSRFHYFRKIQHKRRNRSAGAFRNYAD